MFSSPAVGRCPDHPSDAMQLSAPVLDQDSAAEPFMGTVVGEAISESIGATGGAERTVTETMSLTVTPDAFEQASSNWLSLLSGPTACWPLADF